MTAVDIAAFHNFGVAAVNEFRRTFPRPLTRELGLTAIALLDGVVVYSEDLENEPRSRLRDLARVHLCPVLSIVRPHDLRA